MNLVFTKFNAKASANNSAVFDEWEMHIIPPCSGCFAAINTTNTPDGRMYDWGQNRLSNYGGNWDTAGHWSVTSSVPEPGSVEMLLGGISLIFLLRHRRSQATKREA